MVNPFKAVEWNPSLAQRRKFALSLAIGLPVLAGVWLLLAWLRGATGLRVPALWVGGLGLGLGLLLLAWPQLARPFYLVWYFLGCCLGIVVGNLVLSLLFYLMFTGLGLLMRALGRQSVRKGFDRGATTYWREAERIEDPERYYRQF